MTIEVEDLDVAKGQTLPFSEKKQSALLGHSILNGRFLVQARTKIESVYFMDANLGRIWKILQNFYSRYNRSPNTVDEFKSVSDFDSVDMGEKTRLFKHIDMAIMASMEYGLDVIRDELTLWLKSQIFKAYLTKSIAVHNAGDASQDKTDSRKKIEEAFLLMKRGMSDVEQATFETAAAVTFEDVANGSFLMAQEADLENACTFGSPAIDKLMVRDCKNNSALLRGDHTVLLAASNRGKTACLLTIIRHNLFRRKSVLLVTHEGRPLDIKNRLIQCIRGMTRQQMMDSLTTEEGQAAFSMTAAILSRLLVYLPMSKPGLTVEDVEIAIRREQDRRIAETGSGFDLIVDDYPAKLTTAIASKGNTPPRLSQEYIYNFFTQIALEFNCHVVDAIQTNREGSKVNRGKGADKRLLGMEDVAETWGAMTTATNVIALNRSEQDEQNHVMTFHIAKSRGNEAGWSIVSKTNFATGTTHGPDFPTTWYHGDTALGERVSSMLEQWPGQAIPEGMFYAP